MKTIAKIFFITVLVAFIWVMLYHGYKQLEAYVNKPTDKEIKDQYRKVGY